MAEVLFERFPGLRVEVLGGEVSVEPLPDGRHAEILTDVMAACFKAGMTEGRPWPVQRLAIWLPTGPDDFAMPDLSIVDAASDDQMVAYNCYDPKVFRLVLEVTSAALCSDLTRKPAAYAMAGVPVYVVVDRVGRRVLVLTAPEGGEYRKRVEHGPGQVFTLPGTSVTLSVDALFS
ncbi:Uma2 family endonuclease [Kitasatospora xanthocidica]|uniref:Uma2 family endonuclease n=1 Tax=Kitasatospora xanthocidica TaxID=83382 RepID=UPI001677644B|nr:Uma2 family endonuclease [Kitasatospora xanthocidica]